MKVETREKRGFAAIWKLCPGRHVLALVSAGLIALHLLTRPDRALNAALSEGFVRPVHRALARLYAPLPFSMAEALIAFFSLGLLAFLAVQLVRLVRRGERLRRLYRLVMTLLSAFLAVYALFCLLWGVYYYADDFAERSGVRAEPVSVEQLERVTQYFADMAGDYAGRVPRDENGVCAFDRRALLDRSPGLYAAVERDFPCLAGPPLAAKGIVCSKVLSLADFTGFFFPFTGEANVNTDFPTCLLPVTIAHELAHQRGVAREQEANFAAVLACLADGDPEYVYSAALLAYTHLGNALRGADPAAWKRVYASLDGRVLADFAADRAYWARFDTPARAVSNTVYEGFLQSYDQSLGLKSYGACVDLLVNYYDAAAGQKNP